VDLFRQEALSPRRVVAVERSRVESVLVATAILSSMRELDWIARSRVISHTPQFDIEAASAAVGALQEAFDAAEVSLPTCLRISPRSLLRAAAQSRTWLYQGINLITADEIRAPAATEHPIPKLLYAKGDKSLLEQPSACILNSRTSRLVGPSDTWVQACRALFQLVERNRWVVVSSYGRLPYELVARMACAKSLPIIVVCMDTLPFMDRPERASRFEEHFRDLYPWEHTLFLSPFPPGRAPRAPERATQRDHLIAALSWRMLAGEVRPGGTMERLLHIGERRGISVSRASEFGIGPRSSRTFSAPLEPNSSVPRNGGKLSREPGKGIRDHDRPDTNQYEPKGPPRPAPGYEALPLANWPPRGGWLIHYTRACPGPWPGQTLGDYCQSLIDGRPSSAHSAFHTLVHILEEGRIRGSRRLIRGAFPCVSFTECLPAEARDLIRWRTGLIRWSFEPYGIAVRREALAGFDVRPVMYGDEAVYQQMSENEKFLFQLEREQGEAWSLEKEWRVLGDLNLDRIPADDLLVVVALLDEARIIHRDFGYRVTLSGITAETANRA